MQSLGDFILDDMRRRDMSERQYAEFVGVANSTISRVVKQEDNSKPTPSIEFLAKLSKATRVDLCILVAFVYPELTNTNAQNSIIGALASQLPADKQETILAMVMGWGIVTPRHNT